MLAPDEVGEEGFLAGLRRCGCAPEVRSGVVVFSVTAIGGTHAGVDVETGVACGELVTWPTAPPHWVHFPASISIPITNAQPSPTPGWLMHSRNIVNWGNAADPAQAWLAHVRSVLEEA
jgi:hypothetical protein